MKLTLKTITIVTTATLSIISAVYFYSARFYGNFNCILLSKDNQNVTENYEIYGVSFLGNKYALMQENGIATNDSSAFYRLLQFEHKKGESAESILFYKKNSYTFNKIAYSPEINEANVLQEANYQEKLKANLLLPISLFISLISLLLCIILFTKFHINNHRTKEIIYWLFPITTAIFFGIIIFLTYNKIDTSPQALTQGQTLNLNPNSQNIISISDTTGKPFEFTFSIDGKFWWDKDSLLNYISRIPVKDTFNTSKFIIQAWQFVYENTFHCYQNYPGTSHSNFDCYLLNSIGHGLCGDRAYLFCDIVEGKGYKARVLHHKDVHAFPEVFDGKWKMMDVDYGVCFLDKNYEILSTEEIQNGTEHKLVRAKEKMSYLSNSLTFFIDCPPNLDSGEDYDFDHIEYRSNELKLSNFLLPANTTIKMPIYDSTLMEYTAKIFIPQACNQTIKLPLVITDNNADMFVQDNSFEYFVSGRNIEITALLNPMLFLNSKNLTAHSTTPLNIDVRSYQDSTDIYYILNNFTNDNYDTLRFLYRTKTQLNPMDYKDVYPKETNLFIKHHVKTIIPYK